MRAGASQARLRPSGHSHTGPATIHASPREGSPVQVRFYATLRAVVGRKTVEIAIPDGADVQRLVEAVVGQFPDLGDALLAVDGSVPRGVHVFVNGRGTGYLTDGYATRLAADDRVDIFPAVAGG